MEKPKHDDNVIVESTELPASSHSQHPINHEQQAEVPVASAWPKEPVPLVPDTKDQMFMWLYDGILLAVPLVLIAKIGLVIGAWKLDRQHRGDEIDLVSALTTFLIEFNGQMTTAFTIVFVTIISTLVRRYALWKAQTGARVSDLEQLQGSVSLPSTLKLIWSLRAFTTMSAALVAIWSFYYLGSQASKQEFQRVDSRPYHKMDGYAADTGLLSGFSSSYDNTYLSFNVDDLNAAVIAAVSFTKSDFDSATAVPKGTDSIGSAVLPDLNAILDQGWSVGSGYVPPRPGRHGWVNVAHQSQLQASDDYAAFVGRATYFQLISDAAGPVAIQINGFLGEYTLPTSYMAVQCGRPTMLPYSSFPQGTFMNQSVSFNMSQQNPRPDAPRDNEGHALREFSLSTRWIPYNDQYITSAGSSRQTCNITTVNVDLQIHCGVTGCFPKQMRYRHNMARRNATSFRTPFDDAAFAERFFSALLLSRGGQRNVSTPTDIGESLTLGLQNFLGPPPGTQGEEEDNYDAFLAAEQPRGLDLPLTQYFNTYYMLSQVMTGLTPSFSSQPPADDDSAAAAEFQALSIHGALYDPHYAIRWAWIAVDFAACVILLVAALAACWLRTQTLAPDIFGYVSSLTRDNPHIALPDNGTTLNGLQRARLLRDVRVKIGDVSAPDEPDGYGRVGLALAHVHSSTRGTPVASLKPTVAYV